MNKNNNNNKMIRMNKNNKTINKLSIKISQKN